MAWTGRQRWVGVAAVACLVLLGAMLGGCKSAAPAADEAPVRAQAPEVQPGAERWQDHAMRLPANSPVVFWARPHALLDGAASVREWIFARPEMYGPSGEQFVARLRAEWNQLVGALGMDPLLPDSWQEIGLDPDREIYLAGYPADDEQGRAFIDGIERAVRDKLELSAEAELADELDQMGVRAYVDPPSGLYASAAGAVSETEPPSGFRLVVPVVDSLAFLDSLEELMRGAEYSSVDVADEQGEGTQEWATYFYHDPRGDWPVVMVRMGEEVAIIDVVGRKLDAAPAASQVSRSTEELREMLAGEKTRIEAIGSGRPAAPKPPGAPLLGVSADQPGAASYAKVRGYRKALAQAGAASLEERDRVFLRSAYNALLSAGNWSVADGQLSGVSYGLFGGEGAEGFFRLSITLFGAETDAPLAVSPAPVALGVQRRGLGASLDLGPVGDEAWQRWVGVADPDQLVEYLAAADYDPGLFALSFPRSLALVAANADKVFADDVPEWTRSLLDEPQVFRRLEVASAGINMRALRVQPRFVGLLSLDDATSADKRQQVADAVRTMIEEALESPKLPEALVSNEDAAPVDEEQEAPAEPSPMPTDELVELTTGADKAQVFAYVRAEGEPAYVFVSYGLDRQGSEAELAKVTERADGGPTPRTIFARAEPVTLVSLATIFEPDLFKPLDINILAQRVGALIFSVQPEVVDGAQTIRYDFELMQPPSLQ